jgi:hypothetical protein
MRTPVGLGLRPARRVVARVAEHATGERDEDLGSAAASASARRDASSSATSKCSSVQRSGMPAARCSSDRPVAATRSTSRSVSATPSEDGTLRLSAMIVPVAKGGGV